MASKNAFEAMKNSDWNTVKDMLDKGELSKAYINQQYDDEVW